MDAGSCAPSLMQTGNGRWFVRSTPYADGATFRGTNR